MDQDGYWIPEQLRSEKGEAAPGIHILSILRQTADRNRTSEVKWMDIEERKEIYRSIKEKEAELTALRKELINCGEMAYPRDILFSKPFLDEDKIFYHDRSECATSGVGIYKWSQFTTMTRMIREAMYYGRKKIIKTAQEMNNDEYEIYCECLDAMLSALDDARRRSV